MGSSLAVQASVAVKVDTATCRDHRPVIPTALKLSRQGRRSRRVGRQSVVNATVVQTRLRSHSTRRGKGTILTNGLRSLAPECVETSSKEKCEVWGDCGVAAPALAPEEWRARSGRRLLA